MRLDRFKFENFVKEVYLDSDTTVGLLSGAPFDDPSKWFLSNDQIKAGADAVNTLAGTKRLLYHSLITPKQPGWMDESITQSKSFIRPVGSPIRLAIPSVRRPRSIRGVWMTRS